MIGKRPALAALLWAAFALPASAKPLFEEQLPLGNPPRSTSVRLDADDEAGTTLHVGRRTIRLPWTQVTSANAEALTLEDGAKLLRVVAQIATGEAQALVGGPRVGQLLWQGEVGLRGDPGERQGYEIALEPLEGEAGGAVRVHLRRRAEALSRCDGSPLWIESRTVHPKRLTLTPAASPPPPETDETLQGRPLTTLTPATPLRLLRPTGASDPSGRGALLPPPRLDDGERRTAALARAGAPLLFWRASFADAGFPIRKLELAAPAGPGRLPSRLRVELGKERSVILELDPRAPLQVVELPQPVAPACLSLTALGPFRGPATGIGELRAVTALHAEAPATALAQALLGDTPGGAAAARMLARLGADGARATLVVWPRLTTLGRRRALPVLGPYLGEPRVLAALREAALQTELTEPALAILASSEGPGRQVLGELARNDDPVGSAALEALGGTPGNAEVLLDLLAAEGGADRPRLRAALGAQARLDAPAMESAARAWLPKASTAAQAGLALALSGHSPRLEPVVHRACQEAAFPPEAGFVERYRCAMALGRLPAGPAGDEWLTSQVAGAAEWMQRREALRALAARQSPGLVETAKGALDDDTPRVRAAAAAALAKAGPTAKLRARAVRDPWPDVRRAAVESLADDTEAVQLLRGRVDDPARQVRAVAIAALTAQDDAAAWPAIEGRLLREREFPAVRAAAVRYAEALCIREAAPVLRAQLARGLGPEAEASDVAVAIEALRALRRLGGEARQETEQWLRQQQAPSALDRAAGEPPACQPAEPTAPPTS